MGVAVPIHQGQDFYVPHFEMKIAGQSQGQGIVRDVMQVSYTDGLDEIDSFEVTINNWDADARALKYSDGDRFNPGKRFELWMGYYGRDRLRLMLTGEITGLKPAFPSSGPPTLVVSGMNVLHRLRRVKRSVAFRGQTDSEIARAVCGQLGVEVRTPNERDETPNDYVLQANQYDIVFLLSRARRVGYELVVEESGTDGRSEPSTLSFGPSSAVRRRTYELTYGRSLIEFTPELSTALQVGKVTVLGWDAVRKQKIEETVTRRDLRTQALSDGEQEIEQSFGEREEVVTDQPVEDAAAARRLARERLEQNSKDMVKATGSTIGLPDLRTGSMVAIDGLGVRFTGRYFVTATTHTIGDGGYTTQFECRREEPRTGGG